MLTESMIKRKRAEEEAKYADRVGLSEEGEKSGKVRPQAHTPLHRVNVNMEDEFNAARTDDAEGSELSAMSDDQIAIVLSPRSSNSHENRRGGGGGDYTVSDMTTLQSQSPLTKIETSPEYDVQELREDLSRMKLTIQLLKESNMNIASERQLSEEMYNDEIIKLKGELKIANAEIKCDKETICALSSQLEKLQPSMVTEESSLLSSSSKPTNKKSLDKMVSITRCDSIGSAVSAADCADVKIDDIKGKLLKKFGWTEVEELDADEKFQHLLEEIEQLKQENKRLVAMLRAENINIVLESQMSRPALTSSASTRRVFSQQNRCDSAPLSSSSSSRRASDGGGGLSSRQRNVTNECSSVSVSELKDRFLKQPSM